MLKEKFQNRVNRLQKLIGLDAAPIILENEVRMLNQAYEQYVGSIKEPSKPKYEVGSDEEYEAWLDDCIAYSDCPIEEWREWRKTQ
jgi:hypothetical protein